ncbi:imidazole glycerol phosphate synthase subunit HisH [Aurantiacibacter gangjinensis]|uniref:Imidazole glycerol phosphate synthase subunit HisH n=1 Tax=Aurantiacibacter gangjinensis TaxID=502682 RepID=A0A0G9MRJ9_9SPHN|nr:imidazole glycerol phosphate synthase subunit HisH [Aurantiacibacter gangjinensis]APE28013.1 Imidazole glycerol phosphate synthase amidotransferase subunit [Aurantiacibacter gangjinensis]KLE31948.1 imidazole glycerol phosphate synthase subunit HisH [Aurantiacibacter gangjinensis]
MSQAIALIDYGAGNLHSVHNALKAAGATNATVTDDPALVRGAQRIVLPGVGSFRACYEGLIGIPGMVDALEARVLGEKVPFFGICVGMQLLATRGLEFGETPGLGWIGGEVRRIERTDPAIRVPHMGWNDVALTPHAKDHVLIEEGEAYFLHSYHFQPDHGQDIAAMTDHGGGLVAAVARDNIVGVQFHPEKSQAFGLALLRRFLEWNPQ